VVDRVNPLEIPRRRQALTPEPRQESGDEDLPGPGSRDL
jgi:hypothetical protein